MKEELYFGGAVLAFGGGVLLLLAWLIGVQGMLSLISNYRAHPERYPDGKGLGRWMALTLTAGGVSFVTAGTALMMGAIGEKVLGPWVIATAVVLLAGSLSGLAKYRRMPPPPPASDPAGPRRAPRSPARR